MDSKGQECFCSCMNAIVGFASGLAFAKYLCAHAWLSKLSQRSLAGLRLHELHFQDKYKRPFRSVLHLCSLL